MDGLKNEVRMTAQFQGRFELKVDPKFRLSLPADYKAVFKELKEEEIVVTNGQYQGHRCLDAYPRSEWARLEKKIAKLPQLKSEVQAFQRFYLSGGHGIEIDSNSRILIPPSLRNYAGIQTQVVLVGFPQKFEIWALEKWSTLFEGLAQDFGSTLAAVAALSEDDQDV